MLHAVRADGRVAGCSSVQLLPFHDHMPSSTPIELESPPNSRTA
jgi:hypothetical protein